MEETTAMEQTTTVEESKRPCPKCGKCTLGDFVKDGVISGVPLDNKFIAHQPDGTLHIRCPHCMARLHLDNTRMIVLEAITSAEADKILQDELDAKRHAALAAAQEHAAEVKRQEESIAELKTMSEPVTISHADVGELPPHAE